MAGTTVPALGAVRRPTPRRGHQGSAFMLLAVFAVLACLAGFVWAFAVEGEQTLLGLLLLPVLLGLSAPAFLRLRSQESDFDLGGLLFLSFGLHMFGALVRFLNAADAAVYSRVGATLADHFRSLDFLVDPGRSVPGTGWVRYTTGLAHLFTGSDMFGTLLLFTFGSFWGLFLFYRAFTTAVPDGDRRRYALLLFLWPALAFWPSSIGKEAWMLPALGLAALGAAKLFRRQRFGLTFLGLGLLAVGLVRPHLAMLMLAAVVVGFVFRRSAEGASRGQLLTSILVSSALVLGMALVAGEVEEFLQLEDFSPSSIEGALERTEEQTEQGGSEFEPAVATTPLDYPRAAVTVLVRPFPDEADGIEMLLAAVEGLVLAGLSIAAVPRLVGMAGRIRRDPFLVMTIAFIAGFILVFSAIGNFGILARQRTQLLPFLFVLLALPRPEPRRRRRYRRELRSDAWVPPDGAMSAPEGPD